MKFKLKKRSGQMFLINSNLDHICTGFDNFIKESSIYNYKFYELEKKRLELAQKRFDFDKSNQDVINLLRKQLNNLIEENNRLKK